MTPGEGGHRTLRVDESARIPWDGVLLGWGAVLPLGACAAGAWFGSPAAAAASLIAAPLWGAALLLFFSGVRRGLSFRTEGGPTASQLLVSAALFVAGLGVLLAPVGWALAVLTSGFVALAFEDPRAARRAEAPLYFTKLRPWQMAAAASATGLCGWAMNARAG